MDAQIIVRMNKVQHPVKYS